MVRFPDFSELLLDVFDALHKFRESDRCLQAYTSGYWGLL